MQPKLYSEQQYADFHRLAKNFIDEYFNRWIEFVAASRIHTETAVNQFLRVLDKEDPPDVSEEILWQVVLFGVSAIPGATLLKAGAAAAQIEKVGKVSGYLKYFTSANKDQTAFIFDRVNSVVGTGMGMARTSFAAGKGSKGKFQTTLGLMRGKLNNLEPEIQHMRKRWGNFISLPEFYRGDFWHVEGKKIRISPMHLYVKKCLQLSPSQPYLHTQKSELDAMPKNLEELLWTLHVNVNVTVNVTRWGDETDAVGEWKIAAGLNQTQFDYIKQQFQTIRQESDLVTKWGATKNVVLRQHESGRRKPGEY